MDFSFDFPKIKFSFLSIIGGIILVLLGVIYYLIFHKHHKKNKVELFELVELVTRFYVRSIILIILLIFSAYLIILAVTFKENRTDVITYILLAIIIASASIINYRSYIISSLKDYEIEVRKETNRRKLKIGEVLEFICLIICILAPIWRIPGFIDLFYNKSKLIVELIKYFGISIGGLILMFALNPLNIRRFLDEENVDNNKSNEDDTNEKAKNKSEKETKKTVNKKTLAKESKESTSKKSRSKKTTSKTNSKSKKTSKKIDINSEK